jgi:hypothetical protein
MTGQHIHGGMKPHRVFEQGGNVVKENAGLGEVRDFANQAF